MIYRCPKQLYFLLFFSLVQPPQNPTISTFIYQLKATKQKNPRLMIYWKYINDNSKLFGWFIGIWVWVFCFRFNIYQSNPWAFDKLSAFLCLNTTKQYVLLMLFLLLLSNSFFWKYQSALNLFTLPINNVWIQSNCIFNIFRLEYHWSLLYIQHLFIFEIYNRTKLITYAKRWFWLYIIKLNMQSINMQWMVL